MIGTKSTEWKENNTTLITSPISILKIRKYNINHTRVCIFPSYTSLVLTGVRHGERKVDALWSISYSVHENAEQVLCRWLQVSDDKSLYIRSFHVNDSLRAIDLVNVDFKPSDYSIQTYT